MKRNTRLAAVLLGFLALTALPGHSQTNAVVKRDRVNVRGQPTIFSEVVTQLRKDETVSILEEIKLDKPKGGEPAQWARIRLPTNTTVWINAGFIDPASKTVKVRRLNLRAGPGENFSPVGLLNKGAAVKELRTVDTWMEIEVPTNAWAFVAMELLDQKPTPAAVSAPAAAPASPAPAKPELLLPVKAEVAPAPAPAKEPVEKAPEPEKTPPAAKPAEPAPQPQPQPQTIATAAQPAAKQAESGVILAKEQKAAEALTAPVVKEGTPLMTEPAGGGGDAAAPLPKRIVRREGIVRSTVSIQAPTYFELLSPQTRVTINYLHPTSTAQKIRPYKGQRVVVTGEELIDPRWPKTPVIDLESIALAP